MDRWFVGHLEDFPAVARGQRGMDCMLERYAVPLIITVEDGVLRMATSDEVLTTDVNQGNSAAGGRVRPRG